MSLLLKTLHIQNFRGLKHLEIDRLGRVNLFAGQNRAGKTTLLEAVRVYQEYNLSQTEIADNQPNLLLIGCLLHLLVARGEIHLNTSGAIERFSPKCFDYLFHGYHPNTITIQDHTAPANKVTITPDDLKDIGDIETESSDIETAFKRMGRGLYSTVRLTEIYSSPAVLAKGLFAPALANMWDNIALSDKKQAILQALQWIEPKIADFMPSLSASKANRVAFMLHQQGIDKPLPIRSLGEGLERLFYIFLALSNVEPGQALTIDEFENDLHYTVQPKAWQLLFKLAQQWDVQIFATTHSRDTIDAFQQAWQQATAEAGAFYSLRQIDEKLIAVPYDRELLEGALDISAEIR